MRLFVAVDVNGEVRRRIEEIIQDLAQAGADVGWSPPEKLHFTLKFLGDADVKVVERLVKDAAKRIAPFRITLAGLGYFGSPRFVRVVWAGVSEGRQEMINAMEAMNTALNDVRKEEAPPRPHLTIGRPRGERNTENLLEKVAKHNGMKIGEVDVNQMVLKNSAAGHYEDLAVFPLEGA
ncbi:MAG: RNA 2',3'-cyclic phosphodiesterase [Candidatus Aenigmarchaeota archaeon]|nr:RNA 2',3'-cyclic phosphodiesterase [Candidatus Aenigmarchaeota archaeon]